VKLETCTGSNGVGETPRSHIERSGSKLAKALELEAQLRTVDGQVLEQLTSAHSDSSRSQTASLDKQLSPLTAAVFAKSHDQRCRTFLVD